MPKKRPGLLALAVIGATTLSLLTAPTALAAPTAPPTAPPIPQVVADTAATVLPEATPEEKVSAIRTLGIDIDTSWLVLRDRDFVFKIFDNAQGPLVKDGALQAYREGDASSTVFIRTGIYELDVRDKDNYAREKIERDLARKLKQSAASLLAMPVTDQQLDLSYRDFIFELYRFVTGYPKVKAAALTAFGATDVEQKVFLSNGLLAAKQQDQQDQIDADNQASEAEKARLAARNAKANAASVVLLPVDEALLNLSDDNFIRKLIDNAVPGSEVSAAAWAALRSAVPADWATFIKTGVYDANKRDIQIANEKKAAEDRRITREVKAKAENGLMQPRLVAAAATALAGSDADVANFLKDGQYAVSTQSLGVISPAVKGWYLQSGGGDAWTTPGEAGTASTPGVIAGATWKIVAGLADTNCFSLESAQYAGSYLRQQDFRVKLAANDGSTTFKTDATWCSKAGLSGSGVSLESKGQPGRYLRHRYAEVWSTNDSGQHEFDAPHLFKEDSSWRIADPEPKVSSPIDLKLANDDVFRAAAGNPKSAEVYDAGVRYRDFDNGRVVWDQANGAHLVSGETLTKYLSLGAHKWRIPLMDTAATPDGVGKFTHFTDGTSIYWSPSSGAHFIKGAIMQWWKGLDWERSYLGYPTSDEVPTSYGAESTFQGGWIRHNSTTGQTTDVRKP
jgi:hypothetical protein